MADLVLGLASSHSPQLSTPAEAWHLRGERDKSNPELIGTDGITSNYEGLLSRADVPRIATEITPEKFAERHQRNQKGIARLVESPVRGQPRCFGDGGRRPAGVSTGRQYARVLRVLG